MVVALVVAVAAVVAWGGGGDGGEGGGSPVLAPAAEPASLCVLRSVRGAGRPDRAAAHHRGQRAHSVRRPCSTSAHPPPPPSGSAPR
eukprot:scaffold12431_cov58-Phaeocystis_antarctica.AAC.1